MNVQVGQRDRLRNVEEGFKIPVAVEDKDNGQWFIHVRNKIKDNQT